MNKIIVCIEGGKIQNITTSEPSKIIVVYNDELQDFDEELEYRKKLINILINDGSNYDAESSEPEYYQTLGYVQNEQEIQYRSLKEWLQRE